MKSEYPWPVLGGAVAYPFQTRKSCWPNPPDLRVKLGRFRVQVHPSWCLSTLLNQYSLSTCVRKLFKCP